MFECFRGPANRHDVILERSQERRGDVAHFLLILDHQNGFGTVHGGQSGLRLLGLLTCRSRKKELYPCAVPWLTFDAQMAVALFDKAIHHAESQTTSPPDGLG